MQPLPTLNIVGAGRVGQTLGHLWQRQGVLAVQDVLTTRAATASAACAFIGAGTPCTDLRALRPADLWMLAVPDTQIEATSQALAQCWAQRSSPATATQSPAEPAAASAEWVVFHCSGAQSSERLAALAALGWQTASAHCILSFATAEAAVAQFAGTACALEGQPAAVARLQPLFGALQAACFTVAAEDKLLYHAAAVFATNFIPVIQHLAESAWQASGVPAALLPGLRAQLLQNAVNNLTRLGPLGALTGPAARGDTAAIARQAEVVEAWDGAAGAAYRALSAVALRMANPSSESTASKASPR